MEINMERRNAIVSNHPLLYPKKFFFECRDGWLDLIEELSDNLEAKIKKFQNDFPDEEMPKCIQAKEKYGSLRFSLTTGTISIWEAIDIAEAKSKETCDICGKVGALRGGRWLKTRCDKHMND